MRLWPVHKFELLGTLFGAFHGVALTWHLRCVQLHMLLYKPGANREAYWKYFSHSRSLSFHFDAHQHAGTLKIDIPMKRIFGHFQSLRSIYTPSIHDRTNQVTYLNSLFNALSKDI